MLVSGTDIELKKLQALHKRVLIQEELLWKETSGDKIIEEGDRSTVYFYAKVKGRRKHIFTKLKLGDDDS